MALILKSASLHFAMEVVSSEVQGSGDLSEFWYAEGATTVDADGDLEVPRRRRIVIEHTSGSSLGLVGLQIWRGGLILADWMLAMPGRIRGKRILDVGTGTGISAIVAAQLGAHVVATDGVDDVLQIAQRNVDRNKVHCRVEKLDWNEPRTDSFDVVLGADCVYDDDLTQKLFAVLRAIQTSSVILALDLRFNFEVDSLSVQAHGYQTFLNEVHASPYDVSYVWRSNSLEKFPPQRIFPYDRNGGTFELWELRRQHQELHS